MNDTMISITRDISCLHCGQNGLMDIHNEGEGDAGGRLFRHLGHNPFTGDLHYQCPACGIVLLVDPTLALGEKPIKGRRHLSTGKKTIRGRGILQGFGEFLAMVFLGENEEKVYWNKTGAGG